MVSKVMEMKPRMNLNALPHASVRKSVSKVLIQCESKQKYERTGDPRVEDELDDGEQSAGKVLCRSVSI